MASLQYTWEEASDAAKVVLAALAEVMVEGNRPVSSNQVRATIRAQEILLSRGAVSGALQELVTREVLRSDSGGYVFTVDLMRLWVQQYQRLGWVKGKIRLPGETGPPAGRDRVRMVLVGVSAGLVFLLIILFILVARNAEQAAVSRRATVTALSGTIGALETAIARGAGIEAEEQLAVIQTQSAEEMATRQIPTSTPRPTATPTPTPTSTPTATPTPTVTPTSTPTPTPTPTSVLANLDDTWMRPADEMVMMAVPAGEFEMGSDDDKVEYALQLCSAHSEDCPREWFESEQPVHSVALDSFWIDQTEVTNRQYRQCVEAGVCDEPVYDGTYSYVSYYTDSTFDDYPVVYVSWPQAVVYCEWAEARLPTEAEWEFAARGSERRQFPWGEEFDGARLNYCDINCRFDWADLTADDGYVETAPVGSYPDGDSWCNAHDMVGNVWEWVADWYGSYDTERQVNPKGPSSGESRVLRGGSWDLNPGSVRCATRGYKPPDVAGDNIGFRCAKDIQ